MFHELENVAHEYWKFLFCSLFIVQNDVLFFSRIPFSCRNFLFSKQLSLIFSINHMRRSNDTLCHLSSLFYSTPKYWRNHDKWWLKIAFTGLIVNKIIGFRKFGDAYAYKKQNFQSFLNRRSHELAFSSLTFASDLSRRDKLLQFNQTTTLTATRKKQKQNSAAFVTQKCNA